MNGLNGKFEAPYWGKVIVYLVKEVGLNTLTILAILAMWTGIVDSPASQQHKEMLERTISFQEVEENVKSLFHVSLTTCMNDAQDQDARDRCLEFHKPHQ